MDLASFDVYKAEHPIKKGKTCHTCQLPGDLRAAVEALAERGEAYSVIAAWLATQGHKVGHYSIGRHWREDVEHRPARSETPAAPPAKPPSMKLARKGA